MNNPPPVERVADEAVEEREDCSDDVEDNDWMEVMVL